MVWLAVSATYTLPALSAAMPEGLENRALLLSPSALPCPAYPARVLKVSGWENAAGPQASSRPLRRAARNGTVFITRKLNRFGGEKQFTNAKRWRAPMQQHARGRTANRPGSQRVGIRQNARKVRLSGSRRGRCEPERFAVRRL